MTILQNPTFPLSQMSSCSELSNFSLSVISTSSFFWTRGLTILEVTPSSGKDSLFKPWTLQVLGVDIISNVIGLPRFRKLATLDKSPEEDFELARTPAGDAHQNSCMKVIKLSTRVARGSKERWREEKNWNYQKICSRILLNAVLLSLKPTTSLSLEVKCPSKLCS